MGILDNLPHTCTAKIRTRTQGSMGGGKEVLTTVFSNRACWRQPAGDREQEHAMKQGIAIDNKVYFTSDPELDERHVLIIDSVEYDVVSRPVPDCSVGLGVVWKVMVNSNSAEG